MTPAFDVKSARLDVLLLQLHTADLKELKTYLQRRTRQYKELANKMLFLLDLTEFDNPQALDISAVIPLFARYGLKIVGLHHENEIWAEHAQTCQLVFSRKTSKSEQTAEQLINLTTTAKTTKPTAKTTTKPAVLIQTPIRTGQQVYAEHGDLIVTSAVNEGAEIIADGNIHVYGPMRGRALAGASGNCNARIFIYSMQAELVSIAGIYRNFEQRLPEHLNKKAVQVLLHENRLIISSVEQYQPF